MKQEALDANTAGRIGGRVVNRAAMPVQRTSGPETIPQASVPDRLRRLKKSEVVTCGDFVANGRLGFELWEGPSGFQARAFLKPIYRKDQSRTTATTRKSK
jgi:hypothetical protein